VIDAEVERKRSFTDCLIGGAGDAMHERLLLRQKKWPVLAAKYSV